MLEIIAVILTLITVILLKNKNWIGWPIGIGAAFLYGIVFYYENLVGQSMLQGVFILQSFYGWWYWQIKKNEKITIKSHGDFWLYPILFFTLIMFVSWKSFPEEIVQYLDFYTVALALLANFLLAKSVLQSWYVWIFVDVVLIGLFIYIGLWWTVGLYVLLLMNAIHASIKWKKDYELEQSK